MKEGTNISDIFIVDPFDSWSLELAIKTDYHFAEENPTMPSQDIHPLKIEILINALNAFCWDHDYKTICKFF